MEDPTIDSLQVCLEEAKLRYQEQGNQLVAALKAGLELNEVLSRCQADLRDLRKLCTPIVEARSDLELFVAVNALSLFLGTKI